MRWCIGIVLLLVIAGCGSSDKAGGEQAGHARTLSLALRDDSLGTSILFNEAVEHASGGGLLIATKIAWRAGEDNPEQGTIADVKSGRFDAALVSVRGLDTLGVDAFQPLVAPFLIDSLELERRVLADDVSARMVGAVERLGVVGVGLFPGGLRRPLGITRGLVAAPDYRHAFFGVRASKLAAASMTAIGADPGTFAGVPDEGFDGIEMDYIGIAGNHYDTDGTTLPTNEVLWPRPLLLVVNRDVWGDLGASAQGAIRKAVHDSLDPAVRQLRRDDSESLAIVCRRAQTRMVQASASDLTGLRAAVAPVVAGIRDRDALRRIAALRDEVDPATPASCPPPPVASNGEATPIDGVWETRNDPDDARRLGHPESDIVPENWGHWIWAYASGRWAFSQENDQACTWAYGTFVLRGDRMTVDVTDGGGIAPTPAMNKPGEHFEFKWSRFRDVLRLDQVHDGSTSPDNLTQTPFRLIGRDPARAPFASRCAPPLRALAP
jgi:TRAP-type C4-dicarboxylate transport system substrate-binding protein